MEELRKKAEEIKEKTEGLAPEDRRDVLLAVMQLSRAVRRCPPDTGDLRVPPALGRLLTCVRDHGGVSSRELCELLDLRPSTLSEMLSRAESEGLLTRSADGSDRRVQRAFLAEKGAALVERMTAARQADLDRKSACFSEEEKRQFIALSEKLRAHLESVAADAPGRCGRPGFRGGRRPPFEDDGPRGHRPLSEGGDPREDRPPFGDEIPRGPRPSFEGKDIRDFRPVSGGEDSPVPGEKKGGGSPQAAAEQESAAGTRPVFPENARFRC